MNAFLHHLAALGWGWAALFAALDLAALACAILAAVGRKRGRAIVALLVNVGVTLATAAATSIVATTGLSAAFAATGPDPSQKAKELAEGISVAMNGTALGLVSTFLAGTCAAVCLIAAIVYRPESH